MNNTGLVSISFRRYPPEQIAVAARDAGLSLIEWGGDVHAPANDSAAIARVAALSEKYGVKCSSYGTYFTVGVDPADDIAGHIAAAKALGTRIVRIWGGRREYADMSGSEREAFADECLRLAETAEQKDVTLCFECHHGTVTASAEGAFWIMNAVGSEHFRMYWQPNQFRSHAQNVRAAEAIAPYTKVVHVFNWTKDGRFPLAEGAARWREYLRFFAPDVPRLLEFMPDDDIASLAAEAKALREIEKGESL